MPQPSLLATLLATVLSFVLGGLWYGPVFGKAWMRLVGVTEATLRENFNPAKTYGITFVLAFLASYVFGMFLGAEPEHGAGTRCRRRGRHLLGRRLAVDQRSVRRPPLRAHVINGGYHIVKFVLIGLSFALLG